MGLIYGYLRASTREQDASRARQTLDHFVRERGQRIAAWFIENESGTTLRRPELLKLLGTTEPGDTLLVESIDRLSRMHADDWNCLKRMITERGLNIVAVDLPTTYMVLEGDELTVSVLRAFNTLIIDILAALSRKDYLMRRERQRQGIDRALKEGKYRGRQPDIERRKSIATLLQRGISYSHIRKLTGASYSTIASVRKEMTDHPA